MKVTVIGSGYVGLVSGACLAELGNDVVCLDLDREKVALLERGTMPIHEPGLQELVARNVIARRLHFTTSVERAVDHGTLQFIAVGTPAGEDGAVDLKQVIEAARTVGRHMTDYKVVIDKSTVPVGTAARVKSVITEALAERGVAVPFAVVSNPEFLKEGAAIEDFMRPDRIVLGVEPDDDQAILLMRALYAPFQRNHQRLLVMDPRSAELTKYAANAMLATRISFMNELALLAEQLGADIESVRHGIGSDKRIGYDFLYAGTGYGGSCFPKDVKALIRAAGEVGCALAVLEAVQSANERQKRLLLDRVLKRYGDDLADHHFAVWGLAFKPDTDDMREAPSRVVLEGLLARGASVCAYDPVASDEARRVFGNQPRLSYSDHPMQALEGADALLILTEWKAFRSPDFEAIRAKLRRPVVFDGRNMYDPPLPRSYGLDYVPIGRG